MDGESDAPDESFTRLRFFFRAPPSSAEGCRDGRAAFRGGEERRFSSSPVKEARPSRRELRLVVPPSARSSLSCLLRFSETDCSALIMFSLSKISFTEKGE